MSKKKGTNKKRKKNRCEEINYQNATKDLNNNNEENFQDSKSDDSLINDKENLNQQNNNNESQENLNNEKNEENSQNDNQNNNCNNFDFSNISADDLFSLHLLSIQYMANIINIISEGIFLDSTIQGFRLVLERYTGNNDTNNNADQNNVNNNQNPQTDPDLLGLECTYGFFMSKLIFTYVAFARYEDLVRRKSEGTINYSLQPNEDINTGNILGILALCYTLKGAHGIAERNRNQPIFGI